MPDNRTDNTHCGLVAIVGRPNVGKSTLLNHLLGQKLSITSRKPQTTRHRILGVKTCDETQLIFIDTPGLHKEEPRAMNRYMNKAACSALAEVDVVVFMVSGVVWNELDELVLDKIKAAGKPTILLINKIDQLKEKEQLLPVIEQARQRHDFLSIVPISALKEDNLDVLEQELIIQARPGTFLFPEDQITDRTQRFLFAEMIREKITRQLGDEIPHSIAVEIETFEYGEGVWHINAVILVERKGQKAIVIGKSGARLKKIGEEARKDMERMLEQQVMLKLWVKVKGGWADDERALQSLGLIE